MNDYRIVQIKNTNIVGIAEIKPIWWQRLLQLEVYVLIPQVRDNFLYIGWEYSSFFSLTEPDSSEAIVQDLSKVGDLIIKSKKLEDEIDFKNTKIRKYKMELKKAIYSGVNCPEWQKNIEQMQKEVTQLNALKSSLDNLIFSAIGDSLRTKATEEFKQQTDELTYDRSNTAKLINDIDCQIQAYKMLFKQNSLAQTSSKTAEINGRNATELIQ